MTLAGMATIRIHRNEAFFNPVQPTLHAFFKKYIIPELLTRNLQNPVRAVIGIGTGSVTSNKAASNGALDGSLLYCYSLRMTKE